MTGVRSVVVRRGKRAAGGGAVLRAVVCGVFASLVACGGADSDGDVPAAACVPELALQCTPAFEPTFDRIFSGVFAVSCGSSATGSSCHYGPTAATAQGGLALSDPNVAYDALLGTSGGHVRVVPYDPHCSPLVERLESTDPAFRMPVGNQPLPEAARCAIRLWINNGAMR